jgi:hypothetical protein
MYTYIYRHELNHAHPAVVSGHEHREGRVLSLFSGRRNWDYPNLSPAGEYAPSPLITGGGAHSLPREGVRESQFRQLEKKLSTLPTLCSYPFRRGDIHCGTLYTYVLCGYENTCPSPSIGYGRTERTDLR